MLCGQTGWNLWQYTWRFHKINSHGDAAELFIRKEPNVSSQRAAVLCVGVVGVGSVVTQGRRSKGRGLSHPALKSFDSQTVGQIWVLAAVIQWFNCPQPDPVTFHSTFQASEVLYDCESSKRRTNELLMMLDYHNKLCWEGLPQKEKMHREAWE